jgi:hypothetical protein
MMNPGPIEEAGHVATSIVDALKAQPAVLALTLAQIAMLIFLFYALYAGAAFRDKMLIRQSDFAKHVTQLLAKCVVPDRSAYPTQPATPVDQQ